MLRPLAAVLEKPELTREVQKAVADKIHRYDGVLEVLVKEDDFLCADRRTAG